MPRFGIVLRLKTIHKTHDSYLSKTTQGFIVHATLHDEMISIDDVTASHGMKSHYYAHQLQHDQSRRS